MSEEPPDHNAAHAVVRVVGSTFADVISNCVTDVLLVMHMGAINPWAITLAHLATVFGATLRVAHLDASRNDYPRHLYRLPTHTAAFFLKAGTSMPVVWDGTNPDWSDAAAVEFVQKHAVTAKLIAGVDISLPHGSQSKQEL